MNTSKTTREQISAFADGELAQNQVDMALAALRHSDGKQAWEDYHQIGDLLRSNEASVELSSDFSARMAARLQAEPTIMAPTAAISYINRATEPRQDAAANARHGWRRMAMPGMAVAAATVLALLSTPQLITALKSNAGEAANPANPASAQAVVAAPEAAALTHASIVSLGSTPNAGPAVNPKGDEMLRDPNIDEYLLAHQRFSPSMYSTAQFARSSLLANASDK